jgi:hypothetical protein
MKGKPANAAYVCCGLLAALGLLIFAGAAWAASSSYILEHPTHERCKAHYLREVKRPPGRERGGKQVWCVRRTATRTEIDSGQKGLAGQPGTRLFLEGSVVAVNDGSELGPRDAVVTFTLTDTTRGKRIASFKEPTATGCAIAEMLNAAGTRETLVGMGQPYEYLLAIPACPLARVDKPVRDGLEVSASFAGNASYAPSVSKPTIL